MNVYMRFQKIILAGVLTVMPIFSSANGRGGGSDGGGGNFYSVEEVQKANRHIREKIEGDLDSTKVAKNKDAKALLHQVADALIAKGVQKIKNVQIQDFKNKVDQTLILFTDKELKLNNKPVHAINYPEQGTILVNETSYESSNSNLARHLLTHEVLGLMKENDDDYLTSAEFMEYSGSPASLTSDKSYRVGASKFDYLKWGYSFSTSNIEDLISKIKKGVLSCKNEVAAQSLTNYDSTMARIEKAENQERFYSHEANKARIGNEIILQINREFCVGFLEAESVLEKAFTKNIWGRYNPYILIRVMAQNRSNIGVLLDELTYYDPPAPFATIKRKDANGIYGDSLYLDEDEGPRSYYGQVVSQLRLFLLDSFMVGFVDEILK